MSHLILVRHGESVANAERRFTYSPEEGLSERGRVEAAARAAWLRGRFEPVALYSSPYVRARQTAAVLAKVFALETRVVEELREQFFGGLRGLPYHDLGDSSSRQGLARWDYRPPDGETLREVAARAGPALQAIAERHDGEHVLIVSHGGTMAALRAWLFEAFDSPPALSENAGGYVLVPDGNGSRRLRTLDSLDPKP